MPTGMPAFLLVSYDSSRGCRSLRTLGGLLPRTPPVVFHYCAQLKPKPRGCLLLTIAVYTVTGYIGEFEIVDDHRAGKIVVEVRHLRVWAV